MENDFSLFSWLSGGLEENIYVFYGYTLKFVGEVRLNVTMVEYPMYIMCLVLAQICFIYSIYEY